MVGSVAGDLPEQVKNNQSVNMAAGNGGQKMSQYSWFTVYTSTLKAPVQCFGNHLPEKKKSLFRTYNECGGTAIPKNKTPRMGTPVGC